MEAGIVAGFGYLGFHISKGNIMKIILAVSIPLIIFSFWSFVDFRNAEKYPEMLRLIQELIISGAAAFALNTSDSIFSE